MKAFVDVFGALIRPDAVDAVVAAGNGLDVQVYLRGGHIVGVSGVTPRQVLDVLDSHLVTSTRAC